MATIRNIMLSLLALGFLAPAASAYPLQNAAELLIECVDKGDAKDVAKAIKGAWKDCEAMRGERKTCRQDKRSCKKLCKQAYKGKERKECKKSCKDSKKSCIDAAKASMNGQACQAANKSLISAIKKAGVKAGKCAANTLVPGLEKLKK
ncbi:MAG: hypothetical protein ACE366_18230 [Bradymonadia bacterium]